MRRDLDLIREVLREVAESGEAVEARALATEEHPFEEIAYHFGIMIDAGLVEGSVNRSWGGGAVCARIDRLTWAGNDFLDAVASDRVWSKVKRTVAKTVGSASFESVKALAVRFCTELLMQ